MEKKQAELQLENKAAGPVECLGMTFPSDEARRAFFLDKLKEKLQDPEFRKIPGFPKGLDEDILRLSDPPYYTTCPNPFLAEFVRVYGRPYDPSEEYHREPFAVDVSVGKTDALYKAHSYHTKVPHLAIVPSILHYTKPGDLVLDGFGGSGMTGLAAQWCNSPPLPYRNQLEQEWHELGLQAPTWGLRRAVLNDLSPIASFISYNYNRPFPLDSFADRARELLDTLEREIGWMYQTTHVDGKSIGRINYTVWSEIFSCPECSHEINFVKEALDTDTQRVSAKFACPNCKVTLSKERLERLYVTKMDPETGTTLATPKRVPVLVNYTVGNERFEKVPDEADLMVLERIDSEPITDFVPTDLLPYMHMTHERARMDQLGITHVHHFFLRRQLLALGRLWALAQSEPQAKLRQSLLFLAEQAVWGMSLLARYAPTHFSQVNRYMSGVYYVASQIVDISPWYVLNGKLDRLNKALQLSPAVANYVVQTLGTCATLSLSDESIDYIFTDPPFGENIYYADLNFLLESWHRVWTDAGPEAIVDRAKSKGLVQYQDLMRQCFEEYHRVLKPGRWMTVVFSNSSNAVWRAIQEAMGSAGFVIADVRTLDKQQGSYRQVTSSAMKQDLVISAYKPAEELARRFSLEAGTAESAWAFIDEHLANVPLFVSHADEGEVVAERTAQMLMDRMIAFHVQRGITVPLSASELFAGLDRRYTKIDGMYLRSDQVAEYNKQRVKVQKIRQLTYQVSDEASAILWVRNELEQKPQTFPDLNHIFLPLSQTWAGHEEPVELKHILDENFLEYDGTGLVPTQIVTYLRKNYHDLRGLTHDHPVLQSKAKGRWYNPDPSKQGEMDALRHKRLVKEFEAYKGAKKKLKQLRTEAVRAGFKASYDTKDFQTIVEVAKKLPEKVIQEDPTLLMYYDFALMVTDGE